MDIIETLRRRAEAQQSPNVYDGIEIDEWKIISDIGESQLGEVLSKVQKLIYNWYTRKLVGELRLAARSNKEVNAIIYGGILEGIANVSIDRLNQEAQRRLEDWERESNRNTAPVQGSTT